MLTEINHKKDFAHCKEWGDRNVSTNFKLFVRFHVFPLYNYFEGSYTFIYYNMHITYSG